MATISSPGLGSGLNVTSIVDQLVAVERRPIDLLTTQKTALQSKLSAFGLLKSYTTNVEDAVARLADPTLWQKTSTGSTDPSSVTATSTAAAKDGSYSVQVGQLAQAQSLASGAYASNSAAVGTGTLKIELGTWGAGPAFADKVPASSVDIVIGAGDNTLEGVRAKINAANAGVSASIIKDGSGSRLVIRSLATGAENAMRITATGAAALPVLPSDPPSLASLVYNPAVPASSKLTQAVEAKDAQATINGLAVTSKSNTFADVLEGVTLTVSKVTSTAAQVSVGIDKDSMKKAVADFVKAYNDISKYLAQQTKYDPDTKTAGDLQGDRATLSLQSQLRNGLMQSSGASTVFRSMSDMGIELQRDGTLTVNDSKLGTALSNPTEVSKAFTNAATNGPGYTGLAVRLKSLTDSMTLTDGLVTTRSDGLRTSIKRVDDQVAKYEERIAAKRESLLRQYSALDTKLSSLTSLNSYISQQITNWNKSTN